MPDDENKKQAVAEAQERYRKIRERMVKMREKIDVVLGKYGRGDTFSSVEGFNDFRDIAGEALNWVREDINLTFQGSLKGGRYY